jgi:hypothetical protein
MPLGSVSVKVVHRTLVKLDPGSPYARTLNNIMSLNTWQYLGIVNEYETGKYKLMFDRLREI